MHVQASSEADMIYTDHAPVPQFPEMRHECAVAGLRAVAVPPGALDIRFRPEWHVLNHAPRDVRLDALRVGDEDFSGRRTGAEALLWHPKGAMVESRFDNPDWKVLIEIDPDRLDALDHEVRDGRPIRDDFLFYRPDPLVATPARMLTDHVRGPRIDPLFAEGLTLAVLARGLAVMHGAERPPLASRGTGPRVARARDYIEANLNRSLSVAEIADIACMSPSWFSRAFKSETGQAVHAYVRERRLERAADLLHGPQPIAEIAVACGFADQSHLTRAFRRRYGLAPGAYRRG